MVCLCFALRLLTSSPREHKGPHVNRHFRTGDTTPVTPLPAGSKNAHCTKSYSRCVINSQATFYSVFIDQIGGAKAVG